MTYQQAVISLLTIAILSIAVHELRSQVRNRQEMAMARGSDLPTEVRVVRVDRQALDHLLSSDIGAAREMLGLESRAIDVERNQRLEVRSRLAPLARGQVSEVILPLRSGGRPLSVVVIAL